MEKGDIEHRARNLRLHIPHLKIHQEFGPREDARSVQNRGVTNRMRLREPHLQYRPKKARPLSPKLKLSHMELGIARATQPSQRGVAVQPSSERPVINRNDPLNYGSFERFSEWAEGPWTDEGLKNAWDRSHRVPEIVSPSAGEAEKFGDPSRDRLLRENLRKQIPLLPKEIRLFLTDEDVKDMLKRPREALFGAEHPLAGRSFKWEILPIVKRFQKRIGFKKSELQGLKRLGITHPDGDDTTNGSQENAFRHAFGQALATAWHGRLLATLGAFAHEDEPQIDTLQRVFSVNPATPGIFSANSANPKLALFRADTVADFLNNEIGRRIAEHLRTKDAKELAKATLFEFLARGLYTAEFGPGVVRIKRERLELEEFNRILEIIGNLDSKGFTKEGRK